MGSHHLLLISLGLLLRLQEPSQVPNSSLAAEEPLHKGKTPSEWLKALKAAEAEARRDAADALGLIGRRTDGASAALVQALGDRDDGVVDLSVRALTRIGPTAIPELRKALKSD